MLNDWCFCKQSIKLELLQIDCLIAAVNYELHNGPANRNWVLQAMAT